MYNFKNNINNYNINLINKPHKNNKWYKRFNRKLNISKLNHIKIILDINKHPTKKIIL